MRAMAQSDGSIFTSSEWFLAEITQVCDRASDDPCDGIGCSWRTLVPCASMQAFTDEPSGLTFGDCLTGDNVAYPISGFPPALGQIVLMRWRGAVGQQNNAFEFFSPGGNTESLAMTALQCSGDVLSATFSEGCEAPE